MCMTERSSEKINLRNYFKTGTAGLTGDENQPHSLAPILRGFKELCRGSPNEHFRNFLLEFDGRRTIIKH